MLNLKKKKKSSEAAISSTMHGEPKYSSWAILPLQRQKLLDVSLPWPNRTYWVCGLFLHQHVFQSFAIHTLQQCYLSVLPLPIFKGNQTILCYTWKRFTLRSAKQSLSIPERLWWFIITSEFCQLEAALLTSTFSVSVAVQSWHRHNLSIETIHFALERQTWKLCMPIMRNLCQQNLLYHWLTASVVPWGGVTSGLV